MPSCAFPLRPLRATFLLLLLAPAVLLGCTKPEARPVEVARAAVLTGHSWQVVSWRMSRHTYLTTAGPGASQPIVNVSTAQSCDLDDVDTYRSDGTVATEHGPTLCEPTAPLRSARTWALSQNDTRLTYGMPHGLLHEYAINHLTDKALELTRAFVTRGEYTYEYEFRVRYEAR